STLGAALCPAASSPRRGLARGHCLAASDYAAALGASSDAGASALHSPFALHLGGASAPGCPSAARAVPAPSFERRASRDCGSPEGPCPGYGWIYRRNRPTRW